MIMNTNITGPRSVALGTIPKYSLCIIQKTYCQIVIVRFKTTFPVWCLGYLNLETLSEKAERNSASVFITNTSTCLYTTFTQK